MAERQNKTIPKLPYLGLILGTVTLSTVTLVGLGLGLVLGPLHPIVIPMQDRIIQ